MSTLRAVLNKYAFVWMVIIPVVITSIFVNPIRCGFFGDDWAYARTAESVYETGSYQTDNWSAVNTAFQAYWGALFMYVLGPEHSSLYISTLAVLLLGLIFFYLLAREHEFTNDEAGLLTLFLAASPLFFWTSFSFTTDIPFLSLYIGAIYFYTQGIHQQNTWLMIAGSLIASASLFTRFNGVTIIVGLALWGIFEVRSIKSFKVLLGGLLVPVSVMVFVLRDNLANPTWAMAHVSMLASEYQALFLRNPLRIARVGIIQTTFIVVYLALFCLPLVFLALLRLYQGFRHTSASTERKQIQPIDLALAVGPVVFVLIGLALYLREKEWDLSRLLMPYLPGGYLINFDYGLFLTPVVLLGGILFVRLFLLYYLKNPGWKSIPSHQKILHTVSMASFLMLINYYIIRDRYLFTLLPLTILLLGYTFKERLTIKHSSRFEMLIAGVALVAIAMMIIVVEGPWNKTPASVPFQMIGLGLGIILLIVGWFIHAQENADIQAKIDKGKFAGSTYAYMIAIVVMLLTAISKRDQLDYSEGRWRSFDETYASGVSLSKVTDDWSWQSYHGAFDRFAAVHSPEVDQGQYWPWLEDQYHNNQ